MPVNETSKQQLYIDPYIVHIYNDDYTASGVLYNTDNRVCVLTAGHVIQDIEASIADGIAMKIKIPNCKEIICSIRKESYSDLQNNEFFTAIADDYDPGTKENDAGFIVFPIPQDLPQLKTVAFLHHSKLEHANEELWINGFPANNAGKEGPIPLTNTKWKRMDPADVLTYTYAPPSFVMDRDEWMSGYSGSGVFAEYQNRIYLIGLTSKGVGEEENQRMEEDAVSVSVIKKLLQKHGITVCTDKIMNENNDGDINTKTSVGDIINFGKMIQGNDPVPIEWIIVNITGNRALIVSKYGLNSLPFNVNHSFVSWEKSTLRKWLIEEFVTSYFTDDERKVVIPVKNTNNFGPNTYDNFFLLSQEEFEEYCQNKEYSNVRDRETYIPGFYWLRTVNNEKKRVLGIHPDGTLRKNGYSISNNEGMVRPACWINIDSLETNGLTMDSSEVSVSDENDLFNDLYENVTISLLANTYKVDVDHVILDKEEKIEVAKVKDLIPNQIFWVQQEFARGNAYSLRIEITKGNFNFRYVLSSDKPIDGSINDLWHVGVKLTSNNNRVNHFFRGIDIATI